MAARLGRRLFFVVVIFALAVVAAGSSPASHRRAISAGAIVWSGTVHYNYSGSATDGFGAKAKETIAATIFVDHGKGDVAGTIEWHGDQPAAGDCPGLFLHDDAQGEPRGRASVSVSASEIEHGVYSVTPSPAVTVRVTRDFDELSFCTKTSHQIVSHHRVEDTSIALPVGAEGLGNLDKAALNDEWIIGSLTREWPDCPAPRPGVDTSSATELSCHETLDWHLHARSKAAQQSKDTAFALSGVSVGASGCAFGLALAPEVPITKIGALVCEAAAIVAGGAALTFAAMADDPPDPHFRRIARPRPPGPLHLAPRRGLGRAVAKALNTVFANSSRQIGLGQAFVTSIERAQGATLAKRPRWDKRQMRAARRYAGRLAAALRAQPRLLVAARRALRHSGFKTVALRADDIARLQQQVRDHGLPQRAVKALSRLGAGKATRERLRQDFVGADPHEVAQLESFPALLAHPPMIRAIRAEARALAAFTSR